MSSNSRRIWVIRWRRPRAHRRARHRHVDPLLREPPVELGAPKLRLAPVDRRLEPLAKRVQRHSRLAVAHLAQRELQLALATEELDSDVLDLVLARRGFRGGERASSSAWGSIGTARLPTPPPAKLQVVTCAEFSLHSSAIVELQRCALAQVTTCNLRRMPRLKPNRSTARSTGGQPTGRAVSSWG